jgi:hypothetical protein
LLSEFEAAIGRTQTAWSEQAKTLAQQSLNAALLAARNSTASLLEEAARVNSAAVRKALEQGIARMEESLAASRRIAWLNLAAAAVAFTAAVHLRAHDPLTFKVLVDLAPASGAVTPKKEKNFTL